MLIVIVGNTIENFGLLFVPSFLSIATIGLRSMFLELKNQYVCILRCVSSLCEHVIQDGGKILRFFNDRRTCCHRRHRTFRGLVCFWKLFLVDLTRNRPITHEMAEKLYNQKLKLVNEELAKNWGEENEIDNTTRECSICLTSMVFVYLDLPLVSFVTNKRKMREVRTSCRLFSRSKNFNFRKIHLSCCWKQNKKDEHWTKNLTQTLTRTAPFFVSLDTKISRRTKWT